MASSVSIAELRPQIAYTDLREWIDEAGKHGEIREVDREERRSRDASSAPPPPR